jgi:hypothetical protein
MDLTVVRLSLSNGISLANVILWIGSQGRLQDNHSLRMAHFYGPQLLL